MGGEAEDAEGRGRADGRGGADSGRAVGGGAGGNEAAGIAGLEPGKTRSTHKLLKVHQPGEAPSVAHPVRALSTLPSPAPPPPLLPSFPSFQIVSGSNRGRRLLSPADRNVRPMMEMVRAAVFDMLHALLDAPHRLPPGSRWLDLYSGTGSVGLEAMSRGCTQAHFVEMDPWVVSSVLSPNIEACSASSHTTIHPLKVESFLQQAEERGAEWVGGPFSFISVTPPYELVVYSQLMAQLAASPLLHQETCMVVEYPIKTRDEILDTCGPLYKIKDRKYGRTNVAIYGPAWALEDDVQ
ncbi:unnamed protein product [Closterium sp. Yama58-4]|nr:unnamed protein product [Closterium sp. Yama58-4]